MEFSAATIYDGRLRSGVTEGERAAPAGFDWPRTSGKGLVSRIERGLVSSIVLACFDWPRTAVPVAFVEVGMAGGGRGGGEEKDGDSKFNTAEAKRIVDVLVGVLGAGELKVLSRGLASREVYLA
jgi:hypothetical protein